MGTESMQKPWFWLGSAASTAFVLVILGGLVGHSLAPLALAPAPQPSLTQTIAAVEPSAFSGQIASDHEQYSESDED